MIQVSRVSAILPGTHATDSLDALLSGSSRIGTLPPSSNPRGPKVGNPLPACAADRIATYGLPKNIVDLLSKTCKLAVMVGLDALESSGIVSREGPEPWALPEHTRQRTGVVYASSFAHHDAVLDCVHKESRSAASALIASRLRACGVDESIISSVSCDEEVPPVRKLALQMTLLANAQLAQILKSRGPNTYTSNTCASTASAIKFACNCLRLGEADRMLVVAADTPLSGGKASCMTESFVALGAASSADSVEKAVQPFGAQRTGFVFGEGAVAMLLETGSVASNAPPLARVLSTRIANSAAHGTRMDASHIAEVIKETVEEACAQEEISIEEFARKCVYVSHDTFTSICANAEVEALEKVFGRNTLRNITITNTKCITGHTMGVCVEDVLSVLLLKNGKAPAIAKVDAQFSDLTFSNGDTSASKYALHLAAGMGSHVAVAIYGKS